jgi:ankyrin repeat protein
MGTALSAAAFAGHATIVDLLIANGADVNVIDRDGTPLHWAAYARQSVDEKRYAEVVKKLLAVGADVHAKDPQRGRTPLHKSVARGRDKVAGLLIAAGAEVDARDDEKQATPLHLACSRGHRDAAELLIAKAADVNAKDKDGHTPLWYAKDKDRTEIVKLLRKHGAKE